jgi:WD40 repeat protein
MGKTLLNKRRFKSGSRSRYRSRSRTKSEHPPKKPRSAYMYWSMNERLILKEEGFEGKNIMFELGQRWNAITKKDRKKWDDLYFKDVERYERKMKRYMLLQAGNKKTKLQIKKKNHNYNNNYNDYDKNTSTTHFLILNFNLKKMIFSYLNIHDQRCIYWTNKKLRPLLPDSPLRINIQSLKKFYSNKLNFMPSSILELHEGSISCFTNKGIKLLKFGRKCLKLTKTFPINTDSTIPHSIQQDNGNIIYVTYNILTIYNSNFTFIENFEESSCIWSLCNISELSFAIGLGDGTIKIYTINIITGKYEAISYSNDAGYIWSLVHLPKQNYLLYGSKDHTINVLSLSEGKLIQTLTGHRDYVSSFLCINDETFASSTLREIIIWSVKSDNSLECKKTINADENIEYDILLYNLGNDYMVSTRHDVCEFKIWDKRNFECIKTYKENLPIRRLMVTKNHYIITVTNDRKVNVWRILI